MCRAPVDASAVAAQLLIMVAFGNAELASNIKAFLDQVGRRPYQTRMLACRACARARARACACASIAAARRS
jgi:hypothetical protein